MRYLSNITPKKWWLGDDHTALMLATSWAFFEVDVKYNEAITQKELKRLIHYEPETGVFTWIQSKGGRGAGAVAGCYNNGDGYTRITINGHSYMAHRLAWFYMTGKWPKGEIDHINGVRDDNRRGNLREATRAQNNMNRGAKANNNTGLKGAYFNGRKYIAQIYPHGGSLYIGTYDTPEEAHQAYCDKADELFGEFANYGEKK